MKLFKENELDELAKFWWGWHLWGPYLASVFVIGCVPPRVVIGEYCGYASTYVRPRMALLVAKNDQILVGMGLLGPHMNLR